jgi:hypothetical protein
MSCRDARRVYRRSAPVFALCRVGGDCARRVAAAWCVGVVVIGGVGGRAKGRVADTGAAFVAGQSRYRAGDQHDCVATQRVRNCRCGGDLYTPHVVNFNNKCVAVAKAQMKAISPRLPTAPTGHESPKLRVPSGDKLQRVSSTERAPAMRASSHEDSSSNAAHELRVASASAITRSALSTQAHSAVPPPLPPLERRVSEPRRDASADDSALCASGFVTTSETAQVPPPLPADVDVRTQTATATTSRNVGSMPIVSDDATSVLHTMRSPRDDEALVGVKSDDVVASDTTKASDRVDIVTELEREPPLPSTTSPRY